MTTPDHQSSWEREMGEALGSRVRGLHEAPLDLDSVKGTAMKIRTRRRAAVAGGLLAAAAVIVPVAVLATGTGDDRSTVIDPAQTPSATPTTGSALGFSYLEQVDGASVLHNADGSTVELPGRYSDAAVLADEVVGHRFDDEANWFVDVIDDSTTPTVTTTYAVRSAMATTPDGLTVAFVTTDDELIFYNGELGEQSFGEVDPGVTLSAAVGNGDCTDEAGCHPFLEYLNFEEGEAFEINYEGPRTAPAPGAQRVNDAGDDFLVSVITTATDFDTCGGLYDREGGGQWVFETCDYQVHTISPSGSHTIAFDSYVDGLGPRSFYLLDELGNEVAAKSVDGVVGDVTWSDDTHAVATVYEDGAWRIISLGLDGEEEVLVEGASGNELRSPYRITGQS